MARSFTHYFAIVVAGTLIGAILLGLVGLLLGIFLAQGYVKRGPSDPADGPAYLGIALILLGASAGAILGFFVSLIICVQLVSRKRDASPHEITPIIDLQNR